MLAWSTSFPVRYRQDAPHCVKRRMLSHRLQPVFTFAKCLMLSPTFFPTLCNPRRSGTTQVLFLDSDAVFVRHPAYLFEDLLVNATSAVFWRDFWTLQATAKIWGAVGGWPGDRSQYWPSQESGARLGCALIGKRDMIQTTALKNSARTTPLKNDKFLVRKYPLLCFMVVKLMSILVTSCNTGLCLDVVQEFRS